MFGHGKEFRLTLKRFSRLRSLWIELRLVGQVERAFVKLFCCSVRRGRRQHEKTFHELFWFARGQGNFGYPDAVVEMSPAW